MDVLGSGETDSTEEEETVVIEEVEEGDGLVLGGEGNRLNKRLLFMVETISWSTLEISNFA